MKLEGIWNCYSRSNTCLSSFSVLSVFLSVSEVVSWSHAGLCEGCAPVDLYWRVIHLCGILIVLLQSSRLKSLSVETGWAPFCPLCLSLASTKTWTWKLLVLWLCSFSPLQDWLLRKTSQHWKTTDSRSTWGYAWQFVNQDLELFSSDSLVEPIVGLGRVLMKACACCCSLNSGCFHLNKGKVLRSSNNLHWWNRFHVQP